MSSTAMSSTVRVERFDRVALVELNRPDVLNAVDTELRRALGAALDAIARDDAVGVVVLTGAGRAFSSGADLKSAASNPDKSFRRTAHTLVHDFQPLFECIARMDKIVIAAVNGPAAGVGMSLALACDLMVISRDALLVSPFINIGLIPDGGAAWFLTRRVGYGRALEALLGAQKLSAEWCQQCGIANRVAEPDSLRSTALEWAQRLACLAPIAAALTKRVARAALSSGLSDALALEAELQNVCAGTDDSREAISAFLQKRPPVFTGR
jgi:2-(1,2-epoxy-1,2-dihydrophenyl)acetyl-CoA isomerase